MKPWKCPECGNDDDELSIEDNGCSIDSPELTLLCTAPADDDGDICGHQWYPNEVDEEDADRDLDPDERRALSNRYA